MAAQPVAHGFIVGSIQNLAITGRLRVSQTAIPSCNGDTRGPPTGVFSITAPRLIPKGAPGQNARNISGGTSNKRNGQVTIYLIFLLVKRLTLRRHLVQAAWMLIPAAILLS